MSSEERRGSDLTRKDILPDLCARFPELADGAASPRPGRVWATAGKDDLRRVAEYLLNYDSQSYLSTITAVDTGEEFQVLYHFWVAGNEATVRVVGLDRTKPEVPTIMDITPSANYYEREIHDLMGIEVTGRGRLEKLILADDWPEGNYPLRKDWKGLPGGELSE